MIFASLSVNLKLFNMKKLFTLSLVLFIIMASAGTIFAQELMVNGDLEQWDSNTNPTGWTNAENISQGEETVHGGMYAAEHTSSSDGTKDFQQVVSGITGGSSYTISYWFYDNSTAARTRIWSYWLDGTTTLSENEEELRPDEYSTNIAAWQEFSVTLSAPAAADGFRFEVRVYGEEGNYGGMVHYDDFSVTSAGTMPEPTNYPTDFTAVALGLSANLEWTDATGDQLPTGYLVKVADFAKIDPPVDGTPIADDLDLSDGEGALNVSYGNEMCTFENLEGNTQYFFVIFPYTNGGAMIDYKTDGIPPQVSATTEDMIIILSQDFEDGFGDWETISVIGEQEWEIDTEYGINGSNCAKCTGWDGQSNVNEDWLITPELNMDNFNNEILTFYTADAYDGPKLEVFVSNDYSGGDPNAASWTPIDFETSSGYFEWISSGNIDLSGIVGTAVYIAFKYTSTSSESSTWELDNVLITGSELIGIDDQDKFETEINLYPNPASDNITITAGNRDEISFSIYAANGVLVRNEITFKGEIRIDISQLPEGLYFLQYKDPHGNTKADKLIVN
jgi:hypothetical protein